MAAEEGARCAQAGLGAGDAAAAEPPQRRAPPGGARARWSPQQSPDNRIWRSQHRSLTDRQRHSGRWHRESLPASWVAAGESGPQLAGVRVPSPGGSMSSRRRRLLKEASQPGSTGALPLGGMRHMNTTLDLPRKELAISWAGAGAQLGGSVRQASFRLPQNERVPQRPEGATVQEALYPQQPWSSWPSDEYTSDLILDPMEHEWMLIVAEGQYDSIIGPLSADPSLLSRRDFVTGYSALHWLAKHGRHEDLLLLMHYAEAQGLPVDINARASGGFTPLHVAAMQGHEMLIKLLVGAFGADVHLRDHSGRKAWQYLPASASTQLKELSGALEEEVADLAALNKNNNSRSSKRAYKRVQRVDEVDSGRKSKSGFPATISPFMNFFRRFKLFLSSEW